MANEIYDWLEDQVTSGIWLVDNHNNTYFLDFWDKFFSGKEFPAVKRAFHKNMKPFVESGMVRKNVNYLRASDRSFSGRSTMITYSVCDWCIKHKNNPPNPVPNN